MEIYSRCESNRNSDYVEVLSKELSGQLESDNFYGGKFKLH